MNTSPGVRYAAWRTVCRHSGIEQVVLQLVEGNATTCYGSAAQYEMQISNAAADSLIKQRGHWCTMTLGFLQHELAGGGSFSGGGSGDGLASYVVEWTEREHWRLPGRPSRAPEIGSAVSALGAAADVASRTQQRAFTNLWVGLRCVAGRLYQPAFILNGTSLCSFQATEAGSDAPCRRVAPVPKPLQRMKTRRGDCVVCLPRLLQPPQQEPQPDDSMGATSGIVSSCAVAAARKGHAVMATVTALLGGVIGSKLQPAAVAPMLRLLKRSALPFAEASSVMLVVLHSALPATRALLFELTAADKQIRVSDAGDPPAGASPRHVGWAYNLLIQALADDVAVEYLVLVDLGLYGYKLASVGGATGLGHGAPFCLRAPFAYRLRSITVCEILTTK